MSIIVIAIVVSILALIAAGITIMNIFKYDAGSAKMKTIAHAIQEGAHAFLNRQFKSVSLFAILLFIVLVTTLPPDHYTNPLWIGIGFLVGALFSALAGYIGMSVSVQANVRTTQAARKGLSEALTVAFRGGSVTGFAVTGLALLGVSGLYYVFTQMISASDGSAITAAKATTMLVGFGFGSSLVSLFARIGGGIFTKAADVGADIVGKVESGIPEDDPRNPAVIADNVGDNVGDCAGMGADLFETYAVTLIAGMILATNPDIIQKFGEQGVMLPLAFGATAIIASIIGSFFVRLGDDENIMKALYKGMITTGIISAIGFYLMNEWLIGDIYIFYAALVGLIITLFMNIITEYYTAVNYKPVQDIAQSSVTGAGTNVIMGLAVGLRSTFWPVVVIIGGILTSYHFGMSSIAENGVFGIAIAAVAMLSTTAMVIATDAYGPITDNAGGIAEMAELPEKTRKITDKLDAVGNTTKAVTKGYAIGSAALAALVLFQAYYDELGTTEITFDLTDHRVLIGLMIGALIPFLFSSYCMQSVGRAAHKVVEEVRRQFKEIKGILKGTAKPEYGTCVDIVTQAALHEMIVPGLIAVFSPIFVGFIFGPQALGGLLVGVIVSGFLLALQMCTGGGAWDNAKKYIEDGHHGGKGSSAHKASIVGDTVGDPCKDTAGPALNALIKVINTVAVIIAPLIVSTHLFQ